MASKPQISKTTQQQMGFVAYIMGKEVLGRSRGSDR
jgi:hypothetical protein